MASLLLDVWGYACALYLYNLLASLAFLGSILFQISLLKRRHFRQSTNRSVVSGDEVLSVPFNPNLLLTSEQPAEHMKREVSTSARMSYLEHFYLFMGLLSLMPASLMPASWIQESLAGGADLGFDLVKVSYLLSAGIWWIAIYRSRRLRRRWCDYQRLESTRLEVKRLPPPFPLRQFAGPISPRPGKSYPGGIFDIRG